MKAVNTDIQGVTEWRWEYFSAQDAFMFLDYGANFFGVFHVEFR